MAEVTEGNYITMEAGADLSAKQYYLVKQHSTPGQAVLAAAATDAILGVLDEVPQGASGAVSIAHVSGSGVGKVRAGGNITIGQYLTATSNGKAVAATQQTAGQQPTTRVFGRALEAGEDGKVIRYEKMNFLY